MKELGRLREITFRDAGGGTGKNVDIDEFWYHGGSLFTSLLSGILTTWDRGRLQVSFMAKTFPAMHRAASFQPQPIYLNFRINHPWLSFLVNRTRPFPLYSRITSRWLTWEEACIHWITSGWTGCYHCGKPRCKLFLLQDDNVSPYNKGRARDIVLYFLREIFSWSRASHAVPEKWIIMETREEKNWIAYSAVKVLKKL